MRTRYRMPFGDLVAAAFDGAARLTSDPREVSRLAAWTVRQLLARPHRGARPPPDAFLPAFRLHRSEAYTEAFDSYGIVNNAHPLATAAGARL